MKKILLTGKSSFIGEALKTHIAIHQNTWTCDTLDVRDNTWQKHDFTSYTTVVHVAGLVHQKKHQHSIMTYYRVNAFLAYNLAKKAKASGLKHFIFLSTMNVYGKSSGTIGKHTQLTPKSAYGKSKLLAESLLKSLDSESFKVTILRPPSVYGKGAKGNYDLLVRYVPKIKVFPNYQNQRSMVFIDYLVQAITRSISHPKTAYLFPQNPEYVSTASIVSIIAKKKNYRLRFTSLFNPIIKLLSFNILQKVFGDLIYKQELSFEDLFQPIPFEETIQKSI